MVSELDRPKVSIVVVHWKNFDDTLACLESISNLTCQPDKIIIVDNHSDDFLVHEVNELLPSSLIIRSERNLGYSGGNNLGICNALDKGCDYVWLLNNDVIVAPDSLSELLRVAHGDPDAGYLGPKILMREDPERILSAGITFSNGWRLKHRAMGESDRGQVDAISEVDYLSGSALLVSRSVVEMVGMLDEDFFAYHEDIEWCYRGKKAGLKVLYVPDAKVWHPDTQQRDENSPLVTYYITRNSLLFARKSCLGMGTITSMMLSYGRTLLSWSLRPRWRHKRAQRDALARGLLDFVTGRFGQSVSL